MKTDGRSFLRRDTPEQAVRANNFTAAGDLVVTRDAVTGLVTDTHLGSVADTYTYNGFGEVESYEATVNGNTVYAVDYARDALGRITTKTELIDGVSHSYVYGYDLAGRLTDVTTDSMATAHYDYDDNGDRTGGFTANSGALTGTYDDQDRLTAYATVASGTTTYTYTANGELLTKTNTGTNTTTSYSYDAVANLRSVTLPDGTQIDYVVDGRGRRVGKKINGSFVQGLLYQDQLKPVESEIGSDHCKRLKRFIFA